MSNWQNLLIGVIMTAIFATGIAFTGEAALGQAPIAKGGDGRPAIDIDLPGDSKIADLVALMRRKYPDYAINMGADDLNGLELGVIKLQGASLPELSQALSQAGRGRFMCLPLVSNTIFLRKVRQQDQPQPSNAAYGLKMDIDLPEGATLGDLIALLETKYPQFSYIMPSQRLKDVKLGKINSHDTTLGGLSVGLNEMQQGEPGFLVQCPNGNILYFIDTMPRVDTVKSYNIGPWIGSTPDDAVQKKVQQLDDLIKAAVTAINSSGHGREIPVPKTSYFPEAKIYVLVGTSQGVQTATKIMDTLVPKVIPGETPLPKSP